MDLLSINNKHSPRLGLRSKAQHTLLQTHADIRSSISAAEAAAYTQGGVQRLDTCSTCKPCCLRCAQGKAGGVVHGINLRIRTRIVGGAMIINQHASSSSLLFSSLKLSDTKVFEPQIRTLLGTASHFSEVVLLKLRTACFSRPPRVPCCQSAYALAGYHLLAGYCSGRLPV